MESCITALNSVNHELGCNLQYRKLPQLCQRSLLQGILLWTLLRRTARPWYSQRTIAEKNPRIANAAGHASNVKEVVD